MVKNVKQRDLRQMFSAKVNRVQKSNDVKTDAQKALKEVNEKPSSSTDIIASADPEEDLQGLNLKCQLFDMICSAW